MVSTLIKTKNKQGEFLSGILEGDSKNIIILCHGSRGSKDAKLLKYLSGGLSSDFSVFRFDFSGNGDSEGLLENSTYLKDVSDLDVIVDYFLSEGYNVLSIVGHSKGGSDVFLYVKKYPEKVKSIVAFAPRFNLLESQEYVKFQDCKDEVRKNGFYFYEGSKNHKITKKYLKELEDISNVGKSFTVNHPTLIVHGSHDEVIPHSDSEEFVLKNPLVRLDIIHEENHGFEKSIHHDFVRNNLRDWLKELEE